jgi:hypothetical protein
MSLSPKVGESPEVGKPYRVKERGILLGDRDGDSSNRGKGDRTERGEKSDHAGISSEPLYNAIKEVADRNRGRGEPSGSSSVRRGNETSDPAITHFRDQTRNNPGEQQPIQNPNSMVRFIRYLWGETQNSPGEQQPRQNPNHMEGQDQPNRRPAPDASSSRRIECGDVLSQRREAVENGERKLNKYQKEFEQCQTKEKDVDSRLDAFEKYFETCTSENSTGIFRVLSKIKGKREAPYINEINTNNGEIRGLSNFKNSTKDWHLSEIIFNQFQLVMKKANKDIASFDLKNWRDKQITNESTMNTVELFLPVGTNEHTFEKGSEGFIALAGIQTAQSKFYLLAQYQKAFGKKEVTSITVKRGQVNRPIEEINYRYDKI